MANHIWVVESLCYDKDIKKFIWFPLTTHRTRDMARINLREIRLSGKTGIGLYSEGLRVCKYVSVDRQK